MCATTMVDNCLKVLEQDGQTSLTIGYCGSAPVDRASGFVVGYGPLPRPVYWAANTSWCINSNDGNKASLKYNGFCNMQILNTNEMQYTNNSIYRLVCKYLNWEMNLIYGLTEYFAL
eukprot:g42438.t1